MCGIAGALNLGSGAPPLLEHDLTSVRDSMAARGPDDRGIWIDDRGDVGFAHRRLAIIDLSAAGHQPMQDPETGNQIVFNGEIFNYRSLAGGLKSAGCKIRTNSDTEIILHMYRNDDVACFRRLRGMYAFAIWDARKHALVLARDPFGIKPLYFAECNGRFHFASQVRALRQVPGLKARRPLAAAEAAFFLFGYVPEPITFFDGIYAIPAGSWMRVDKAGVSDPVSYAPVLQTLESAAADQDSRRQPALPELSNALEDSVRHHLVADVPVGIFLSAGLDSATLATLAVRNAGSRVKTITLAFDEYVGTAADEAPTAEAIAAVLGTDHKSVRVTLSDFESGLPRVLEAMDQPTIDGINTYFVSKAAAEAGLKVALSGVGGDELLGGYAHFKSLPRLVSCLSSLTGFRGIGRGLRAFLAEPLSSITSPKYAGLLEYGSRLGDAYLLSRCLFAPWELPKLLGPEKAREGLAALVELVGLPSTSETRMTPHAKLAGLEWTWYLRNQLLRDTDWASMAHSVEVRVPFVDFHLFERLAPLLTGPRPPSKSDLAATLKSVLPQDVIARPKSGFQVPIDRWLAAQREQSAAPPAGRYRERGLRPWSLQVYAHFLKSH